MRVFLEHDAEEGGAGGEDQLVSSHHVPVTHLQCERQCFSRGLFYDNTLMPLFLRRPSQTLLCYYVSEWQPLSNPSLGSITSLYSIAHWLGIFSGGEQSSVDVVITKSRSECYLRSGVITASLLFITLPVL